LDAFLRALDSDLASNTTLMLIGGAALSFYAPLHSTSDIDHVGDDENKFAEAYERLKKKNVVPMLPLQRVTVHHQPEGTDERWTKAPFKPPLRRLAVLIPERHDLVLMKIARG
jgi:hypothetical protein